MFVAGFIARFDFGIRGVTLYRVCDYRVLVPLDKIVIHGYCVSPCPSVEINGLGIEIFPIDKSCSGPGLIPVYKQWIFDSCINNPLTLSFISLTCVISFIEASGISHILLSIFCGFFKLFLFLFAHLGISTRWVD